VQRVLADLERTAPPDLFAQLTRRPPAAVGAEVAGYRLERWAGRGGSGAVYQATRRATGERVALKITYPIPRQNTHFLAEVWDAIRAVCAVRHDNVVRVLDFGEARPTGEQAEEVPRTLSVFLAMEWVDGEPFGKRRDSAAGPDVHAVLQAAASIADALDTCHTLPYVARSGTARHGLVHGDLKPDNILVRRNGAPVVLDFMMLDLQRLITERARRELHERGGPFYVPTTGWYGTRGWMAPEQATRGQVSARSDIFALGACIASALSQRIGLGEVPTLHDFRFSPTVPSDVSDLCGWMMSEAPEDRPATMAVVRQDIVRLAER
jgi:serine/threonine protein kinase